MGPSLCRGTFIPSPSLYFVRRTATDILNFSSGAEVSARSSTQPEVLQGNDPHRPRASGGIGHLRLRLQGHTSCQDTHALVHSRTRTCTRTSMHSRERALTRACIHAHIHALTRANMLMRVHRRRNWSTPSKTSGHTSSHLTLALVHSRACTHTRASMHSCERALTRACIHAHVRALSHAYMRTRAHTHSHTCAFRQALPWMTSTSMPSMRAGTERFSRQSSSLAVSLMKSISCSGRKSSRARLSNARTASLSSLHIPN